MSIKNKLLLAIAATLLGLLAVAGVALTTQNTLLLEDRKSMTRQEVETAISVLASYEERRKKGELAEAEARQGAKEQIRALRFGDGGYFWINDRQRRTVMHPLRPELEGVEHEAVKDAQIKSIQVEIERMVGASGEGFLSYRWSKPGLAAPVPKISYAKVFEPWGWVVGTGIFVDDVDALFWRAATDAVWVIACALIVVGGGLAWTGSHLARRIKTVAMGVDRVAQGDLTMDIDDPHRDEIGELSRAANAMRLQLRALTAGAQAQAEDVNRASREITGVVESQAATASQMSASIAEITSTMEELSASSSQIAEHAQSVAGIAKRTWEASKEGSQAMGTVMRKMEEIRGDNQHSLREIMELGGKSKEISKVMEIINAVADQTKLIAFNAALEAASAGEVGRRFGVVAAEIRRLANSVTGSTGEIEIKINEIQEAIGRLVVASEKGAASIEAGMRASSDTVGRLNLLEDAAHQSTGASQQISLSTQQQRTASDQVVMALIEIVESSAHTAESIRHVSEVSKEMTARSAELGEMIGRFRIDEG